MIVNLPPSSRNHLHHPPITLSPPTSNVSGQNTPFPPATPISRARHPLSSSHAVRTLNASRSSQQKKVSTAQQTAVMPLAGIFSQTPAALLALPRNPCPDRRIAASTSTYPTYCAFNHNKISPFLSSPASKTGRSSQARHAQSSVS